jgi:hypothetical protein
MADRVSDQVAHILLHLEAEMANSSPAHTANAGRRAQKIRDLLEPMKTDSRKRTRRQLLIELRTTTDTEMRAALLAIDADDEVQGLYSLLREWAETGVIE